MRRCIILVNKIKDAINFMLKSDGKRAKIIVAMGLVAIVLIIRNTAMKLKNS